MYKRESIDYTEIRKKVSKLYFGVLNKKLPIREALVRFPKDCEDKTIIAAWHALCHLESDEDLRAKDPLYTEVQDDYIEQIAFTLQNGEELPQNIINSYIPYHQNALTPNSTKLHGIIQNLKKFLCC